MEIIKFEEINSTNTYAKENIEKYDDKTIVIANHQTAGRGRFKRTWTDLGSENIYMSIILKPSNEFSFIYANLTQYLSLTLCKIFEDMDLKPEIRWPNDILINKKKVVGILCETVMRGNNFKGLVLGTGINLNAPEHAISKIDRPATALNIELGHDIDKTEILEKLLERFFDKYDDFIKVGFPLIRKAYLNRTTIIGKDVKVSILDKIVEGKAEEIDVSGNLILRLKNGERKVINMGELV